MQNKKEILKRRFFKLEKHYTALKDLKFCIDNFEKIESYYQNSLNFANRYIS
jgi:hypothetical protein